MFVNGILQSMMCKIMLENIPTEFPLGTYDKEFLTRKFNKLSEESLATVVNDQLRKLNKTTTLTPRSQRALCRSHVQTPNDTRISSYRLRNVARGDDYIIAQHASNSFFPWKFLLEIELEAHTHLHTPLN